MADQSRLAWIVALVIGLLCSCADFVNAIANTETFELMIDSQGSAVQGDGIASFRHVGMDEGFGFQADATMALSVLFSLGNDTTITSACRYGLRFKLIPLPQWQALSSARHRVSPQMACFQSAVAEWAFDFTIRPYSAVLGANGTPTLSPSQQEHNISGGITIPTSYAVGRGEVQHNVIFQGQYVPVVLICEQGYSGSPAISHSQKAVHFHVSVTYEFLNRGGVQSGVEDIPLMNVFLSMVVIYLVFLLLGCAWLLNRKYRLKVPVLRIQWLLLGSVGAKTFDAAMSTITYSILRSAVDPESTSIVQTRRVCNVCADLIFLSVQLVMCRGYSTVYPTLSARDKEILGSLVGVYAIFKALFEFDRRSDALSSAYEYIAGMARFLLTGASLISLLMTTEAVRRRMIVENTKGLIGAYLRLIGFTKPFTVYVLTPLVVLVLTNTIISWRNKYIEALLTELTTVYYFLIVMYYWRWKAFV